MTHEKVKAGYLLRLFIKGLTINDTNDTIVKNYYKPSKYITGLEGEVSNNDAIKQPKKPVVEQVNGIETPKNEPQITEKSKLEKEPNDELSI